MACLAAAHPEGKVRSLQCFNTDGGVSGRDIWPVKKHLIIPEVSSVKDGALGPKGEPSDPGSPGKTAVKQKW